MALLTRQKKVFKKYSSKYSYSYFLEDSFLATIRFAGTEEFAFWKLRSTPTTIKWGGRTIRCTYIYTLKKHLGGVIRRRCVYFFLIVFLFTSPEAQHETTQKRGSKRRKVRNQQRERKRKTETERQTERKEGTNSSGHREGERERET